MSGNLIDNQINNKYQQGNIQANTGYQANPQAQYVKGGQPVDTTPQTDTFDKPAEKKRSIYTVSNVFNLARFE